MFNEYEVGVLQETRDILNEYSIKGYGSIYGKLKNRMDKNQAMADKYKTNYHLGSWNFKLANSDYHNGYTTTPLTTDMVKRSNALDNPGVRAQLKVNRDKSAMDKIKKHAKWLAERQVKNQLSAFD